MSIVMNFAPGVGIMLLKRIFAVSSPAVLMLYSYSFLFRFLRAYITAYTGKCGLFCYWDLLFMDPMTRIRAFYSLSSIRVFAYALK